MKIPIDPPKDVDAALKSWQDEFQLTCDRVKRTSIYSPELIDDCFRILDHIYRLRSYKNFGTWR